MVRFGAAKAASEGSLTVLDDERLPCETTLLEVTFLIQLVFHSDCSKAAMNASCIFEFLLVPHKHAG